jgi:uncharacterized protein YndB with AHSA1/START domain/catechol 2,3-dioxygenase-like lactoylglutathione lyase family enzyme
VSVKKFGALVLFTNRFEQTVAFYRTLGLALEAETHEDGAPPHFACELGPLRFAIYEASSGNAPPARGGGSEILGWEVASLEQTMAKVKAIGASVYSGPETRPWGVRAVVLDPDGRPVEVWESEKESGVSSQAVIHATAKRVYRAFTDSADIRKWYDATALLAVRVGGHFAYADATGDVYESGEYLEVMLNRKLRFRFEHHSFYRGSEVEIRFTELDGSRTEVSIEHGPLSLEDARHAQPSWDWALTNLKSFLEEGRLEAFNVWWLRNKGRYD